MAICLVGAGVLLGGYELFLRSRENRVVPQEGAELEGADHTLVRYTARGKRLVPNSKVVIRNNNISGLDVGVNINALGFRDAEIPAKKRPDELRVLVLGDSITMGAYLPAEEVYVEQAQEALAKLLPGRKVELINAWLSDVGLVEELDLLEEQGVGLDLDMVVLAFYLNDTRPPWGFPAEISHRGWRRRHSLVADKIYRTLRYLDFVKRQGTSRFLWTKLVNTLSWRTDRADFKKLAEAARFDWGAAWQEDSWPIVERGLARLKALSSKHGFRVAVLIFPVAYQVYADFTEDTPQRRMAAQARAQGFPVLDLLPGMRESKSTQLFFDRCHPNRATNAWVGQMFARFLKEQL